jgi:hypothetical protein
MAFGDCADHGRDFWIVLVKRTHAIFMRHFKDGRRELKHARRRRRRNALGWHAPDFFIVSGNLQKRHARPLLVVRVTE